MARFFNWQGPFRSIVFRLNKNGTLSSALWLADLSIPHIRGNNVVAIACFPAQTFDWKSAGQFIGSQLCWQKGWYRFVDADRLMCAKREEVERWFELNKKFQALKTIKSVQARARAMDMETFQKDIFETRKKLLQPMPLHQQLGLDIQTSS